MRRRALTSDLFSALYFAMVTLLFSPHPTQATTDYRVLSPSGTGPHPAVLLVPGCSGFTALNGLNIYEQRAAALQAAGHVVVFVDYLGGLATALTCHICRWARR